MKSNYKLLEAKLNKAKLNSFKAQPKEYSYPPVYLNIT